MAREAKFTSQFAVVGTDDEGECIVALAALMKDDKAPVVRAAVDLLFGLHGHYLRPGDTVEKAAQRAYEKIRPAPVAAIDEGEPVVLG